MQVVNPRHRTPPGQSVAKPETPLLEYPSRECKLDMKESEGNMFSPLYKEYVQRLKHPGSCIFAEPELLNYRKAKRVVQNEKHGHKNPNNSHNNMAENHDEIELYQENSNWST